MHGDMLYYVRDKYVRSYDINTGSDIGLLSVRKFGSPYVPPRTLSYNPAEKAVVLTISSDNGLFELTALPKDAVGEVKDSSTEGKRGSGQAAIFVARNRFAVLNKTSQVCSNNYAGVRGNNADCSSLKCEISRTQSSSPSNPLCKRTRSFTEEQLALFLVHQHQSCYMISSNRRPLQRLQRLLSSTLSGVLTVPLSPSSANTVRLFITIYSSRNQLTLSSHHHCEQEFHPTHSYSRDHPNQVWRVG